MSDRTRLPRRRAGFTLIELLVAIAILGILTATVVTTVWQHLDRANQTGTKGKLDTVHEILQTYKTKHGEVPDDITKLLEDDPRNNMKAWLTADDIKDTWGHQMVIKLGDKNGEFEVISYGEDGIENGFGPELGINRDISSRLSLDSTDENR